MTVNTLLCVVLLPAFLHTAHAFWWPPPTTTARSTAAESPATVLKQIPLTYFRTYTYQPMPGNPYAFSPFYGSAMQSPLLHAPRYEPFLASSYANKYAPLNPLMPQEPLLSAKPSLNSAAYTVPPTMPPTRATTTTTSTTTTTTPAPTTTTSTTTTTSAPLPPPPPPSERLMHGYGTTGGGSMAYPTYNRRAYMGAAQYPYRPHYPYPYPEYATYKTSTPNGYAANGNAARVGAATHIQFVPCMCPVTVANNGLNGLPMGTTAAGNYLAQGRTADVDDDDMLADEDDSDDEDGMSAAETEMKRDENRSKVAIEAELEQKSEVKPLEILTGPFTSNKIDGETHTQTDNEGGV